MNDGLAELEEHRQPEHTGFCFFHVGVAGNRVACWQPPDERARWRLWTLKLATCTGEFRQGAALWLFWL